MSSPLRVLVIAPTPFFADRGCHIHIAEQAWALQRQNIRLIIATYGLGRDVSGLTTIRTWRLPWYRQEAIGPNWHKFYLDILLFFTAWLAAWRFKPQIIHGHLHEGCLIGWGISRLFRLPLVFDCQGSLTGELLAHNFSLVKPVILRRCWYGIEQTIDHLPDIILAQSTEMRRELITRFNVNPARIIMAYDGVNTRTFQPRRKDPKLLTSLRLPASQPVIVYLGGLSPHKGVNTLLQAFAVVLRRHPDTYLLLMGYPNVASYQQLARDLGISHRTRITGRVRYEDAPRYLALGDIAVAPKRTQTEANGKIYNYMAAGLPTVAFDTVVNRDILGDLGIYTHPADDYRGLAQAIINLLNDKTAAATLARQVRDKAVAGYSWDKVAERIITAYQKVSKTPLKPQSPFPLPAPAKEKGFATLSQPVQFPWQLQVFRVSIRKQAKWRWLKQCLAPHLTARSSCLDVGSGVGTLSYLQEQLGGRWTFTETDRGAAGQTRTIVQGPVLAADIYSSVLTPASWDIITVLDVIEHVAAPDRFLRRVSQLLRPGGHAFITTPAADQSFYLFRYLAAAVFNIDQAAHGHTRDGFSWTDLAALLQPAGLAVVHRSRFSKPFTEAIELAYNAAYATLNRRAPAATGYNLTLSPASQRDFTRHKNIVHLLRVIHPLLLGLSRLDDLLPDRLGYEWGIVVKKPIC